MLASGAFPAYRDGMKNHLPILFVLGLALLLPAGCQTSDTLSSAASQAAERKQISGPLAPHKDPLFAYRTPMESRDGGDYLRVPYDEQRDINGRDEMPVRKAKSQYISRLAKSEIRDFTYSVDGRNLAVYGAGKLDGVARLSLVYLHGKDGTREWGFDDERFGGNFSRLKTLVVKNGGAYYSPDFTDFDGAGLADISALVSQITQKGGGKVIVACGSMGVQICWSLAKDASARKQISGMVILGGFPDSNFLRAAYSGAAKPIPLYIAHGFRDPVYDVAALEDFYSALKAKDYPVRMTVFDTGNHGTPVRMIDWRQALNWIMSKS